MGFRLANVAGRAALVDGDHYFDLAEPTGDPSNADPMVAITISQRLTELSATLGQHEPTGRVSEATLGPPVPRPQKSFAVGLNYQAHADKGGIEVSTTALVFTKFPSCLVGPTAYVEMRSDFCDYEGELVVVIGTGGKDIARGDAWDHVVGVTVGQIRTSVNGEVRQNDTIANMMFDVPTLISYLSRITTLVAGDIIFTGTPDGIGAVSGKQTRERCDGEPTSAPQHRLTHERRSDRCWRHDH